MTSFQITLDGNETFHNRIKHQKVQNERNEYKLLLNNIFEIFDTVKNLCFLLRINYTKANLSSICDIMNDIPDKYKEKIIFSFQQVWQTQEIEGHIPADEVINRFIANGFKVSKPHLEPFFYRCYADVLGQIVVAPNGNIFKCTARDFENQPPDGILNKDGVIEWTDQYYRRMSKTTIEYENCLTCPVLPACWGPCSQKLLEYQKGTFDIICNVAGVKQTIYLTLTDFYKKVKSL
ncbi:MAG: SPASM domain-containing protein [Bacteroidales bacterium]|jgi:uncharacterized protein|nr:SPASM domain-containing protein [Bacteroidales bacterium]